MPAKTLMIQGSSSSAGKSLLTAALCRIYARAGVRVAPFKAQNMSNNAAVCSDGSEIGRAQAVQAVSCGLEPTAEMNPILLKPQADAHAQVIVMGRPWDNLSARRYYQHKQELWSVVTRSLDRLRETYDLIIVEGAGSPVELNLRAGDIVNMALALYAQSPVLLVGDIDRGGIFAQLLGTLWLLEPEERELLKGFLVNKFRGDPSLFVDGVRILEERGGVPVLGVVPYLHNLSIPEEDAVYLDEPHEPESRSQPRAQVEIAVIRLPHIANFDDFDPLATEPGVRLCYVHALSELGNPQAIILPGTKSTLSDLTWLRTTGLADEIVRQATLGTAVVGICGGYQMLGRVIHDPDRVESGMKFAPGLGLLPVETVFVEHKETHRASGRVLGGPGWLAQAVGLVVNGYEIHMGRTPTREPWLALTERSGGATHIDDGACSADGRIWGCYLHGLFENADLRRVWLASLGWSAKDHMDLSVCDLVERLDRLADAVEAAIDMEQLGEIIWAS